MATQEPRSRERQQTPPLSKKEKAQVSPEGARFYSTYDIVKRARSLTPMGQHSPSARSEPIRRRLRQHETFDDAVRLLKAAQKVVVLAGAGISTSVGIPDFRSKDGLYNNVNSKKRFADPQELFTKASFCDAPLDFYSDVMPVIPKLRAVEEGGGVRPEDLVDYVPRFGLVHAFFKLLDDKDKLRTIYTQNIDGLEKAAGVDAGRVINCHGSWDTATCMTCGGKVSADDYLPVVYKGALPLCECAKVDEKVVAREGRRQVRARPKKADVPVEYLQPSSRPKLRKSESTPSLKKRRRTSDDETSDPLSRPGLLKPDITFFDEGISKTYGPRLLRDTNQVDLFLIIGTSLPVEPVNKLPFELPASVPQIWISREHCRRPGLRVDIELLGDCDLIVEELCRRAGWSSALGNRLWRNRFGSNLQSRRQLSELHRRRSQAAAVSTETSAELKAQAQGLVESGTEHKTVQVKKEDKEEEQCPTMVGGDADIKRNDNDNRTDSGLALRPALPPQKKPKEQTSQTATVQKPLPPTKVKIEADLGTDWKWYIRPR